MSDLDGESAFDKVLDRLTNAEIAARVATERCSEAESRARVETTRANDAANALRSLEHTTARGLPKLAELWTAADVARSVLPGSDSPELARLRAALDAARDYCDQVPF